LFKPYSLHTNDTYKSFVMDALQVVGRMLVKLHHVYVSNQGVSKFDESNIICLTCAQWRGGFV